MPAVFDPQSSATKSLIAKLHLRESSGSFSCRRKRTACRSYPEFSAVV